MNQVQLNPNNEAAITLQNASWVFILSVLKQLPAGTISDNGQEGLITLFNNKLIEANKEKDEPPVQD